MLIELRRLRSLIVMNLKPAFLVALLFVAAASSGFATEPQLVSSALIAPGTVMLKTENATKTFDTRRMVLIEDLTPHGDWFYNTQTEKFCPEYDHKDIGNSAYTRVINAVCRIILTRDSVRDPASPNNDVIYFPAGAEQVSLAIARVLPK